ncbi:MAG: S-methyl-5-thioribose-1-phosphate isomerase [Spirochaetales bacterium]|nr:S-methyl-5-thioribose-1-phosphate isomerase [Spirochaetales bacterium]
MLVNGKHYRTVWMEGKSVHMINQPLLPHQFVIYTAGDHRQTAEAIRTMIIRGAGAIGVAAGYALAQAVLEAPDAGFEGYISDAFKTISSTRPTAQNLFYALDRVSKAVKAAAGPDKARQLAVNEAESIADEDVASGKRIGELGNSLIKDGYRIMTHCNAGWLAFADWGSALAPVYFAARDNKKVFVWVDETRPRLQGANLTAWELSSENIPLAVISDNAAGYYMRRGEVDLMIVGSDRIAVNGDVANKIGTYEKAVLAHENGIPFYVAAPTSTIDWNCQSGVDIPIEERSGEEVLFITGMDNDGTLRKVRIAPDCVKARNPAFDVTPAEYIKAIITEKGIVEPKNLCSLRN